MQRRVVTVLLIAMAMPNLALPARAQSLDDPYNIIAPEPGRRPQPKPEPWLPPKYETPRSERLNRAPPPELPAAPRVDVPPAIMVPETGRVLPNMRTLSPSGPNGTETGQDRAMRCAHQLGAYGADAGNPAAYLGSCVNQ
ncbi:hypothetical protein [Undibacter mobilis]|uniref:Uncharacterized protein n=1 Tax=Undibacter mobilis TaxID=2292256 RepID=A0A371BCX4_9BRAD|nr:hypothetical protein [Undibacter mobilis]RDV05446.1 hypothetical protein DXH78_13195 [Undibacter mobilis]